MNASKIPTGKAPPHDINVVVEIPPGSQVKYEPDKDSGATVVDRLLFTPMAHPAAYGFIPGTVEWSRVPRELIGAWDSVPPA